MLPLVLKITSGVLTYYEGSLHTFIPNFSFSGGMSQLVQRPRIPDKPAITSDNVEVKGRPVSQQH